MKTSENIDQNVQTIDKSLFEIVGTNIEQAERISTKPYSYWKSVFLRVIKSPTFIIAFILLVIVIIMACSIGIGLDAVPTDSSFLNANKAPSAEHLFGTGKFGEDLWNKVWIGTRVTLLFTLIVASIQIMLGVILGSIWGFYSKLDIAFIEFTRFITLIPSLILWLVIIFLFSGNKSMGVITFAISLTSWVGLASLIRVQILLTKNTEYNVASRVLGTPGHKIIRKNIMPKILPIIIQSSSFAIPNAIAIDSLLAYYGFGFIPSGSTQTASLGSILNELLSNTDWQAEGQSHLFYVPIGMVAGISLIFFLVGKVFADSLDPKTHR